MECPEDADLVLGTVGEVVDEVGGEETEQPDPGTVPGQVDHGQVVVEIFVDEGGQGTTTKPGGRLL